MGEAGSVAEGNVVIVNAKSVMRAMISVLNDFIMNTSF